MIRFHRQLLARLPKGFTIDTQSGGKHPYLFGPDGEPVRDEHGRPIAIPSTPQVRHAMLTKLAQIKRAGVEVEL